MVQVVDVAAEPIAQVAWRLGCGIVAPTSEQEAQLRATVWEVAFLFGRF
ncbi:MAG: hypothetical protein NZ550_06000 [Fimbriimonadales bacterium]|nr:hypothetical protein [Fimbriimonadales bacterium]MDW8052034.1 hypothetical protein [Armatimonadota bacterium]